MALGISAPGFSRTGLPLRFRRQDTRIEAFLRNLLTIARNPGGVNAIDPTQRKYSALLDGMQLPRAVFERKIRHATNTQLVSEVMGDVHQRFGHAIHIHSLPVLDSLGR